jgi:hypothetical protein
MIGQDGNEEDDELFLDVDTDSEDGISKPEVPHQSVNVNGEDLTLVLSLIRTLTLTPTLTLT